MKLVKTLTILFIGVTIMAKNYLGAELYSKETIKYGRFELRMKMVYGAGILSTFFLYYNNSYMGNPEPWREIDLEVLGKTKNGFQSNIITGNAASKTTSEKLHSFPVNLNEGYHTYAVEWTPDYIAWYFDSKEVRRATGQQVTDCQQKMQSYRFNLWISSITSWVGSFNPSSLPQYQYINWIKYYSYTPGQGPNGTNFSFAWQDNFDSFDSKRWAKANYTFDDNLVDFSPDNIVVKDGYLILCLTTAQNWGHKGSVPIDQGTSVEKKEIKNANKNNFELIHASRELQFSITQREQVQVSLFSLTGKKIADADLGFYDAGTHRVDMKNLLNSASPTVAVIRVGETVQNQLTFYPQ